MRPEAIIFDFDGVIIDSEPMHEAGLRAGFEKFGMRLSPELYRERFVGLADRDIHREVCRLHWREASDAEFAAIAAEKWIFAQQEFVSGRTPVFEGTLSLLREAAGAGVPVGICSGARRREIEHVVGGLGIAPLLRFIVSADEVTRSKPDPEPSLRAVGHLGLPADVCVTIEDTDKGIASAKAAGVRVVAVGHSLPASRLTQADWFVSGSDQLSLEVLGRWFRG
jgi:beta-phosphoglucomutase